MKLYEGRTGTKRRNRRYPGSYVEYTIAAGVIAELLRSNKIKVNRDNKDKIEVLGNKPTGDR